MDIDTCLKKTRYRVFLMWCDYFQEAWSRPSLTDKYLMQVAAEVRAFRRSLLSSDKTPLKISDFLLVPEEQLEPKEEIHNFKDDPEVMKEIFKVRFQGFNFFEVKE